MSAFATMCQKRAGAQRVLDKARGLRHYCDPSLLDLVPLGHRHSTQIRSKSDYQAMRLKSCINGFEASFEGRPQDALQSC